MSEYMESFGEANIYVDMVPPVDLERGGKLKLLQADYHRNGVGGIGAYWVIADWTAPDEEPRRMLICTFGPHSWDDKDDEALGFGYTQAIDLGMLDQDLDLGRGKVGVAFGVNSWRSADLFEEALVVLLSDLRYLKDRDRHGAERAAEWNPKAREEVRR